MAKFRSLSEVIQAQIKSTVQEVTVPVGSPTSVTFNASLPTPPVIAPQSNVLRWGFSTWGIEPVIGASTPQG